MAYMKKDEFREERINLEIVVDAYDEEERAMGWYSYLTEMLDFPFEAKCIAERPMSPIEEGEIVKVTGMAQEDACLHEMFVEIQWQERSLAVPLAQLEGMSDDEATQEALADWHYWVDRGYEF